jgi:hypothetical protein
MSAASPLLDRYTAAAAHEYDGRRSGSADLVVCTRFLNWIPPAKATLALGRLREVAAGHAIVGASVRPRAARWLQRLRTRSQLALDNAKRRRPGRLNNMCMRKPSCTIAFQNSDGKWPRAG